MNLKNRTTFFFIPLIVVLLALGIWKTVEFKKYQNWITTIEGQICEGKGTLECPSYTVSYTDCYNV